MIKITNIKIDGVKATKDQEAQIETYIINQLSKHKEISQFDIKVQ